MSMLTKSDLLAIKELLSQMEARQDKKYVSKDEMLTGFKNLRTEFFIELSKTRDQITRDLSDFMHDQFMPCFEAREAYSSRRRISTTNGPQRPVWKFIL